MTSFQVPGNLSPELADLGSERWQRFWSDQGRDKPPARHLDLDDSQWRFLFAVSDFVFDSYSAAPDLLQADELARRIAPAQLTAEITDTLASATSEGDLQRRLRRLRRRWMLLVACRDLLGMADLEENLESISAIARALIDGANAWLYRHYCKSMGTPCDSDGQPQYLMILAMGKLGAKELNFSSDIDLIFTYPSEGETRGGSRPLDNHRFFLRLGQRLIAALDDTLAEGFVYRVDMRLRPYGDSGPLVMSFAALEEYYQDQGREWERFAMVKASVLGGPEAFRTQLGKLLKPFVYRRYIDFGVLESIRQLKRQISIEVRRRGLGDNIKLGEGGIRELEFIVQSLQLIRGGREPSLQVRGLLPAVRALTELEQLKPEEAETLASAYRYLRKLEHTLQEIADRQTQRLPDESLDQQRVVAVMGAGDWDAFEQHLRDLRTRVHALFQATFADQHETEEVDTHAVYEQFWQDLGSDAEVLEHLESDGYEDAGGTLDRIRALRDSQAVLKLPARGKRRLAQLMPHLVVACGQAASSDQTLERLLEVVRSVLRRTAYLELLVENLPMLEHLVDLVSRSSWIGDHIASYPLLLDELLFPTSLYQAPTADGLTSELRQMVLRIEGGDVENLMEALRTFKQTNELKVAAADVSGRVDVSEVSRHLTRIAETILETSLAAAWKDMTRKYGQPAGSDTVDCLTPGFQILAYGKFGSEELGYGSDLDLVFLHRGDPAAMTDGDKPLEESQFYTRLTQRLVHLLSIRTNLGLLYEVDTRLRPSGNSGLLVSHIDAFGDYQRQEAWTWEHQALIRARPVAGDPDLARRFGEIRDSIIRQPRTSTELRQDISDMRDRMRGNLDRSDQRKFDIKQGPGGLVDIEFLVQFWTLAEGHRWPEGPIDTRNADLLRASTRLGILSAEDAEALIGIYRDYRNRVNRMALQQAPARVPADEYLAERTRVCDLWRSIFTDKQ